MLVDDWAALEADFQRYYAVDLGRVEQSWSSRKLWALIAALPAESMLWRLRLQNDDGGQADFTTGRDLARFFNKFGMAG